ncbi:hypothetical protein ARMGADRAFT_124731 [Armillaria gallica]|uniref:Uncharacterized protein n=1 Tax=Armillaria gallica TaxID=47427 RepID=A0A2H3DPL3_ARMGA|nr:hypothetical protein ARMGADRAFT_124731 [Armillaria gallica]
MLPLSRFFRFLGKHHVSVSTDFYQRVDIPILHPHSIQKKCHLCPSLWYLYVSCTHYPVWCTPFNIRIPKADFTATYVTFRLSKNHKSLFKSTPIHIMSPFLRRVNGTAVRGGHLHNCLCCRRKAWRTSIFFRPGSGQTLISSSRENNPVCQSIWKLHGARQQFFRPHETGILAIPYPTCTS